MNRKANGFSLYWIVMVVLLGIVVPAAAQAATPVPEGGSSTTWTSV